VHQLRINREHHRHPSSRRFIVSALSPNSSLIAIRSDRY